MMLTCILVNVAKSATYYVDMRQVGWATLRGMTQQRCRSIVTATCDVFGMSRRTTSTQLELDSPTHSCGPDDLVDVTGSGISSSMLRILARMRRNLEPCRGFVKKSPHMSSVGQYSTRSSPPLTRSVTKKYLMLMCLVRRPLDARPLRSSNMAL